MKHDGVNVEQAKKLVFQQLKSLQLSGIRYLPKPTGEYQFCFVGEATDNEQGADETVAVASTTDTAAEPAVAARKTTEPPSKAAPAAVTTQENLSSYLADAMPLEARGEALQTLQNQVANCTQCEELASCRNQTVFGVGNPQPALCFVGEGPGADEDRQGVPFVGQAGQLLTKIIEACQLSRDEVYILNTVKCRPPGNRNPTETELGNCWPYAVQQLEILQPSFICCLGSVAAKTLLNTTQSIGKMRGKFFRFRGSRVIVTYHPAYLLRNPTAKRKVWDDMKMLMAEMGRPV